jgi:hypothetical protein
MGGIFTSNASKSDRFWESSGNIDIKKLAEHGKFAIMFGEIKQSDKKWKYFSNGLSVAHQIIASSVNCTDEEFLFLPHLIESDMIDFYSVPSIKHMIYYEDNGHKNCTEQTIQPLQLAKLIQELSDQTSTIRRMDQIIAWIENHSNKTKTAI